MLFLKTSKIFMKKILLLFLIIVCFNSIAYSQEINYNRLSKKIDSLSLAYLPYKALRLVHKGEEISDLTNDEKIKLKLQKLYILILSENYDHGIKLSLEILKNKNITLQDKIQTKIYRALFFELLDDLDKCQKELQQIDTLYKNFDGTSKYYAMFLYRKSSYYRVRKKYTLAKKWALESKNYAKKHQFKSEESVAIMLLGLMSDNEKTKLNYYNKALRTFTTLGDKHGQAAIILAISKIYLGNNQYQLAEKCAKDAIKVLEGSKIYSIKSVAYLQMSKISEGLLQFKKALRYYKLYEKELQKNNLISQQISVSLIEVQYKKDLDAAIIKTIKAENKNIKWLNNKLVLGLSFLALILFVIIYLVFDSYNKNKKIKFQKKELNEKNENLNETLSQKEILLQELHHRTKNNMSLVSSFIDIQFFNKKHLNALDIKIIKERIQSLILAHQNILRNFDSRDCFDESCNLNNYFTDIIKHLLRNNTKDITYNVDIPNIILKRNTAVPLGIVINELTTNTLIHGVKADKQDFKIKIKVRQQDQTIRLNYSDNGIKPKDVNTIKGTGSAIIQSMVKQLKGKIISNSFNYEITVHIK